MNKISKINDGLKIDVIIPTLNEEETIGQLIHDIRNQSFTMEISILVIDGGSTDQTKTICKKENVKFILQRGKGKGGAMREAVEISDADIIVFIDGDGTYSINDLGKLLEPILNNEADMVMGSRVLGDREKGSITTLNTFGNKIFNSTINFALKSKVTDSLSGYRAMRRETFFRSNSLQHQL